MSGSGGGLATGFPDGGAVPESLFFALAAISALRALKPPAITAGLGKTAYECVIGPLIH
jgi:hypothetical protein